MRRPQRRSIGARRIAGVLLAAWVSAAAAQVPAIATHASRKPYYVPGAPVVIASPDYPAAALAAGKTAQVDVEGTVQPDGGFIVKRVAGTSDPAFEQSVREVVKFWRFIPALDSSSCKFQEYPGTYRVWFEIEAGKAKVSVSMAPRAPGIPAHSLTPALVASSHSAPEYPRSLIRTNVVHGLLVAYIPVRRDGSTGEISILPGTHHPDFEAATLAALRDWRYEPPAEWPAEHGVVCAEVAVEFKLTDPAPFPGMSTGIYRPAGPGPRSR